MTSWIRVAVLVYQSFELLEVVDLQTQNTHQCFTLKHHTDCTRHIPPLSDSMIPHTPNTPSHTTHTLTHTPHTLRYTVDADLKYLDSARDMIRPERNTLTVSYLDVEEHSTKLANVIQEHYYQ